RPSAPGARRGAGATHPGAPMVGGRAGAGAAGPGAQAGAMGGGPGRAGVRAGAGGAGAPARTPPFNPDVRVLGFMTVVPMVLLSALLMIVVSLLTRPPSQKAIERYFPASTASGDPGRTEAVVAGA